MKTANYNIRLDPAVKQEAERTFEAFGLNLSEAINIFLHKSIMVRGLPFEVREPQPSAKLLEAMAEAEQLLKEYANGTRKTAPYTNAHDLLQEILNEEDEDDV